MTGTRKFVFVLICLLPCGAVETLRAQSSNLRVIEPDGYKSTGAPYSPGILADRTLYISGQGSRPADGTRPTEFRDQVKQALGNVRSVLKAAGMDFANLAWVNIYVANRTDLDIMNEVYWKEIGSDPPARTVLIVSALPGQETVEINAIAVQDTSHRHSVWPHGWPKGKDIDPPAMQAGDVLYLSAQSGANPSTGKIPAEFPDEVRQSLDNVAAVLSAANMTTKNVLWVNPYMSASGQYDAMGHVYKTYFEFGNTPGRGTIEVAGLPRDQHIVFSCIAGADLAKRKTIKPRNMPPSATASPGILYGNTLYLSAKDGFIPGQGTPDFDLQLRQSMRNLLDGLEEADMSFSDVVFSTVYLRQMQDFEKLNPLYRQFFKEQLPARTTLQQNNDPDAEAAEQISFIAVKTGHKTVHGEDQ
jgi:enamine deaminase RidA (YjgF/YER057c/UK114 family)